MHLSAPAHGLLATSAVAATTAPVAVGAALAAQYRGSGELAAVFFGDGAVEEGVFWESLNFACLRGLRILFVCEDNDLAIHTPAGARQGFRSIAEAVAGFRCQAASGEGVDLPAVISQTHGLLSRMTDTSQPGILHLRYFRFLEHVGPREDFAAGYRRRPSDEDLARWDPVRRFEQRLDALGVAAAQRTAVRDQVQQAIDDAVRQAQVAPLPPPSALLEDVFAE
jgi:pyruvate dehydrogenase E1 component alpha subunit